jgi:hypothetical protein
MLSRCNHGAVLWPYELYDYRVVTPRPSARWGCRGAQLTKPTIPYSRLLAGVGKRLFDLLEGFSPIREDPRMVQKPAPAGNYVYIISLIAKKNNPGL